MELLPANTVVSRDGIFVVEIPPKVDHIRIREARYVPPDTEEAWEFYVALPWQYLFIRPNKGDGWGGKGSLVDITNSRIFWAKEKVRSFDQNSLIPACLPNVHQGLSWDAYFSYSVKGLVGNICLGSGFIQPTILKAIENLEFGFYDSAFSYFRGSIPPAELNNFSPEERMRKGWNLPNDFQSFEEWVKASEDPLCFLAWKDWTSKKTYNIGTLTAI